MSSNWIETIGAVNAYASALTENKATKKAEITVAVFDSQEPFKVIRKDVKAKEWTPIAETEVQPRGMTPLFDAIGTLVQTIKFSAPKKASIVVVTDGAENSSREIKRETAKTLLDELRAKAYDVVFIGADFDAFGQGASVGVSNAFTLNMSKGNYETTFKNLATRSAVYGEQGAEAVIGFFDDGIRGAAVGK